MKILPLLLMAFPIAASLSIISPVQAESSSSCSAALETVQKTLQKKTIVGIRSWNLSDSYKDYPKGRKNGYVIQLAIGEDPTSATPVKGIRSKEWHRAAEVMKSDKLQASLATRIIQSCPRIGSVMFLLRQPGTDHWRNTFGLMGNGEVRPFTCLEGPLSEKQWGKEICF